MGDSTQRALRAQRNAEREEGRKRERAGAAGAAEGREDERQGQRDAGGTERGMDFDVKAHWTSRLEAVLETIGGNLQEELEQMGADAVMEARERVRVKTGETRMNITLGRQRKARGRSRRKKDMVDGTTISAPFPAAHLEFGTKKMRAFPFMLPAVMAQKRRALMRIAASGIVG